MRNSDIYLQMVLFLKRTMTWYDHHFGKLPEHADCTKEDAHHLISQQAYQQNSVSYKKIHVFFVCSTFAQKKGGNKTANFLECIENGGESKMFHHRSSKIHIIQQQNAVKPRQFADEKSVSGVGFVVTLVTYGTVSEPIGSTGNVLFTYMNGSFLWYFF